MTAARSHLALDAPAWQALVDQVAQRHQVPGIVAGVLRLNPNGGTEQRLVVTTGVTNLRTGVPNDRNTLCQVGSITKVVTATMIMQLRDEGRLDLDTPVVELLTDLTLDSPHTATITVRHLLTHTSGIDGDLFTDTGRGDDAIEKYVETLKGATSLFAPETGWSYCNSGWVLLGRIIEVLDERTWDASLQARVAQPLGLTRFLTLPESVMSHTFAHGHIRPRVGAPWEPHPVSSITRSMGPAGLITSTADDLLSFGAAFLRDGLALTGNRLLSGDTVEEMTARHWTLPAAASLMAPSWAIGWMRDDWDGHPVYWHGGTTMGQNAWFYVLPHDDLVLVVFTNGGAGPIAAAEIYRTYARELAGTTAPPLPEPNGSPDETTCDEELLGTYGDASTGVTIEVEDDGRLSVRLRNALDAANPDGQVLTLYPTDRDNTFVFRADDDMPWAQLAFETIDGAPYAYVGIRALPRRERDENDTSGSDS